MAAIEIDGVRLGDLSLGGWIAGGIGVLGLAVVADGLFEVVADLMWNAPVEAALVQATLGGLLILFGLVGVSDNATAEVDATCDNCGAHVRTHSGRDSADEAVIVEASGPPRRAHIGPVSVITQRQTKTRYYCSGTCADEDARVFIDARAPEKVPAPEVAD